MQPDVSPKSAPQFLYRLFRQVLPMARGEIVRWTERAMAIPDLELRQQALESIRHKRFHADGGCVYAACHPACAPALVRLIVALQTISDYLDNLCDRCGRYDEEDFTLLHQAMRDAIRPGQAVQPYYRLRGHADDGGYLQDLVRTCQETVRILPAYGRVQPFVEWLIDRYCELQVHKHVHPAERRDRLTDWWRSHGWQYPGVHWWEFAAATGSTLGVFSLFLAAAAGVQEPEVRALMQVYFPWICGLHILLDYLIDLEEDQRAGDFNFVRCYPSMAEAHRRIGWFAEQSWRAAQALPGQRIHQDVVRGLLAMYLSDGKVGAQAEVRQARRLVWSFGPTAWAYYAACLLYRRVR
ncbi:tetraprenyl-beta-curcumene synthase family protein [Alicyclobacillus macrosporangiidus]|uniref:tetraprenyl-beta-curcumene synthase family protein n=1 Tax=Alicyclobacillus macrosporangiidus TaxID=392015 RepID=UPI0026F0EB18|nr:tetraprenyl-beta-curcumene synthase family protein [Alicyclobacillus macrosporangiidus]